MTLTTNSTSFERRGTGQQLGLVSAGFVGGGDPHSGGFHDQFGSAAHVQQSHSCFTFNSQLDGAGRGDVSAVPVAARLVVPGHLTMPTGARQSVRRAARGVSHASALRKVEGVLDVAARTDQRLPMLRVAAGQIQQHVEGHQRHLLVRGQRRLVVRTGNLLGVHPVLLALIACGHFVAGGAQ